METRKIKTIEESNKETKREKIFIFAFGVIFIAVLVITNYLLDEWAVKTYNCNVCDVDYLQPQCRLAACEPVVNTLRF